MEIELPTGDALAIAGLTTTTWANIVQRGRYAAAPPTMGTKPRMFSVDDLICLTIIRHYMDDGSGSQMAGRIAAAVRAELTKGGPGLEVLYVATTSAGTPRRVSPMKPPPGVIAEMIPVAELRRVVLEAVARMQEARC